MGAHTLPPARPSDRLVETLGLAGIVCLVGATGWAWLRLPEVIPIHFGLRGYADGWGPRYFIFLLPGVGIALYWFLTTVAYHPDLYTHAQASSTTPSGLHQYLIARQLFLALRAFVIVLVLMDVIFATLVATGTLQSRGTWLLPVELISLAILIGFYLTEALRVH